MASAQSAISSAFQSNTTEDANSLRPSRAAPPIPVVAYANTAAARAPEQGERPIYQSNTAQHRAQHQQQYAGQPVHPQHFSRPSTQHTVHSQAASPRGRQHDSITSQPPEAIPPKKRSNSFSFLRRSSSTQPASRIAQAQQQAAAASAAQSRLSVSSHQQQPSNGNGSVTSGSTGLFRARSRDSKGERNMLRKTSKMKQQQLAELERQQRAHEAANRQPPSLPQHNPLPGIDTFGGEHHTTSHAYTDSQAPPAVPAELSRAGMASAELHNGYHGRAALTNGDYYEPSGERSASMTNRGRYSYASSTGNTGNINSPRRVRRRKDPTPFNVLVIGTKNSGKTSFISFLRNSLALRSERQDAASPVPHATKTTFTSQYLETEIDGERVGVTLWDSAGFEKNIVDLQLREMTAFIESKFEDTFSEEQKVIRSPGFRDTHIHCVFLVLDPIRLDTTVAAASAGHGTGGLDADLDLQVLKSLWGKTTVIPVIAKADTLTTSHMTYLKRAVWQSVKGAKLSPLDALELDLDDEDGLDEDDDDYAENGSKRPGHARQASLSSTISDEDPYIPMSILSPDPYSMPPYTKYAPKSQTEIGRRYAWGFASPFDPQHCDFIRLRDTIFSEWRSDLRELSRVKWYEQWRTSRLRNAPATKARGPSASFSKGIPIRDAHEPRTSTAGPRAVPRTAPINTQHEPMAANVGMAITTPGGMEQPQY